MDLSFFKDKKVLVTGHTGFKGAWMCEVLLMAGANVTGYALEPPTEPNLFEILELEKRMVSINGDIRDLLHLKSVFYDVQPEIVIHLAAQPLVRESYEYPVMTYETNVMGTVNVMECVRFTESVRSVINVTTDKVYQNNEWDRGYAEDDILNGFDPYSNSKSCSELVTSSYVKSFLNDGRVAVSTMRAGNVIGGGDFATDRIIPDCVRAAMNGREIVVRNPFSIRPYQHVLESVMAYLMVAKEQYEDNSLAGCYNVGPEETDCKTTGELVTLFCDKWNEVACSNISWIDRYDGGPHESRFLKLDCTKLKKTFNWNPRWNVETAVEKIIEWTAEYIKGTAGNVLECTEKQIAEFLKVI